ncbi:MAG: choice-of-anchor B family protein, partial [Gammaproteobacteria bacterium]
RRPSEPTDAGCYAERGYIHDAQCVNYYGPDSAYWGHEICFCASANTGTADSPFINSISIIDVTDKNNVVEISNSPYGDGFGYSHQGWLTGDRRFYLHNDELDEFFGTVATTNTRIWDMTDLDSPKFVGDSTNGATSIDHNMYTRGRRAYASNYTSGLRVFDSRRSNLRQGHLDEVAFFDMYPENDNATFEGGTWSNYSFFVRRSVIGVSSMDRGLFMLSVRASQRDDDDDDDEDDNDEND